MPDNTLKVGAEFDVGPIVSGAQQASASFKELGSVIEQQAARFAAQGVAAEDNVKILQGLGYSAKEAAAAVAALGGAEEEVAIESEAAAASMSGFERAVAQSTVRLAAMEGGLGMMGYPLARLASFLPGLAFAFEAALPIALVAAFIPEIEKLMKASLDLADAIHAVEESSQKQNDELLKLDEEYTKITQGPIAGYEKALADIPLLSLNVTSESKVLTKQLDEESHWWTEILAKMQQYIIIAGEAASAGQADFAGKNLSSFAYTANDAEKAITIINDKVLQNKDLSAALTGINLEIVKAEHSLNDEKIAGRSLDAQRTQQAIDALNTEKQYLETQQKITTAKERNTQAEATKAITDQTAREIAAQEKLQETISKTAAVQTEANLSVSVETAKALPELSLPEVDTKKKAVAEALDAERTAELEAADAIYQIKLDADTKEIALYRQGTEEYRKAVAKKAQDEADYDLQIAEISRQADEKKVASNREYEDKYRAMLIRQADDAEKAAQRMAELEIAEAKRAQEQVTEDQKRAMELRQAELKAAMTGIGGGPLTEALKDQFNDEQLKAYDTELQRLTDQLARATIEAATLSAKLAGGGILTPEEVERLKQATQMMGQLGNSIGQLKIKQTELQAEMLNSWQTIEQAMQKALNTGFNTFNQQFLRMLETGRSFTSVMVSMWNSMVESFITSVLKMGEQWVATELLKLTVSQSANQAQTASTLAQNAVQRLDDAKTAAAKAMASTPFPLDLIVGPLVFAAALAFTGGGIVPGSGHGDTVPAMLTPKEMVLPANISTALTGAVPAIHNFNSFMNSPSPSVAGGGNTSHVTNHYRPTINVTQNGGKMSVDEISDAVDKGMRKGRIRTPY